MKNILTKGLLGLVVLTAATFAKADVSKNERALLIVSELDQRGDPALGGLYRFLEGATIEVPRTFLGSQYGTIQVLANREVTRQNFRQALRSLAGDIRIKAIDVIIALHGTTNRLAFEDGTVDTETLASFFDVRITPGHAARTDLTRGKLRLLYSTACFGRSHIDDWLAVGFDAVIGAYGVNANAEFEYPSVLGQWALGQSAFNSLAATNLPTSLATTDGPLVMAGRLSGNFLQYVNSKKSFGGLKQTNINSDPVKTIQTRIHD